MNAPGDYDDVSMEGLLPAWYEYVVPADVQKNVIAAIPEVRLIWNNLIKRFQVVYRCPEKVIRYWDGGFMRGWELLAFEFTSPLRTDEVLHTMRRWEDFNRTLKENGFKDLDDWIEKRAEKIAAQGESDKDALYDEFFGTESSTIKHGSGQIVSRPYSGIVVPRKVAKV